MRVKRVAILFTMILIGATCIFGQSSNDSITMKKVFGGYKFIQGGQRLNMKKLIETMEPNPQAFEQINSAENTYALATVASYAGGALLGWATGKAIAGEEPDPLLITAGAAFILASIPLSKSFNKKAKKAVETYNGGLQTTSFWDNSELKLAMTGNGFGVVLKL